MAQVQRPAFRGPGVDLLDALDPVLDDGSGKSDHQRSLFRELNPLILSLLDPILEGDKIGNLLLEQAICWSGSSAVLMDHCAQR